MDYEFRRPVGKLLHSRMASPLGLPQAALYSSSCLTRCTVAVFAVMAMLESRSQQLAEATAATTTSCASSKPEDDCGSAVVNEACTQDGKSISPQCYCDNKLLRYCSDICRGESKSQLCTHNCPDFSEHEEKPCLPSDLTNNLSTALISVAAVAVVGVITFFLVTFMVYRRRAGRTRGTSSYRDFLKRLCCKSETAAGLPTEVDNLFPDVERNAVTLRDVPPNESVNGTTVAISGAAHDQ